MPGHDGFGEDPGGIRRWLLLSDGLGLDRDDVVAMRGVQPGAYHLTVLD